MFVCHRYYIGITHYIYKHNGKVCLVTGGCLVTTILHETANRENMWLSLLEIQYVTDTHTKFWLGTETDLKNVKIVDLPLVSFYI